jgi:hypothetical protein
MEMADWALPAMLAAAATFAVALLLLLSETRRLRREVREDMRELRELRTSLHEMEGEKSRLLDTLAVVSTKLAHLDALAATLQETKVQQRGIDEALSILSATMQSWDARAVRVYDEVDKFLRCDEVVGLSEAVASDEARQLAAGD